MFAGNLGALLQTNVKRLLAYSSIAHAGYILVAFAAVTFMSNDLNGGATPAYAAVLFYLLSYALVKIGAFTIVSEIGGAGEKNLSLDNYAGLAQRQPFAAATLSLFLLSLLGLPVTAGFFGKFYIFKAAVNSHLLWLAVMMAINQHHRRLLLFAPDRGDVYEGRQRGSHGRSGGALPGRGEPSAGDHRHWHGVFRAIPQPGIEFCFAA